MKSINRLKSTMALSLLLFTPLALADINTLSTPSLQSAVLAGGCAGCHGTDGRMIDLPNRSAQNLEAQLLNFKYDRLPSTVMGRITRGFSDEELAEIAQYFASLGNQ